MNHPMVYIAKYATVALIWLGVLAFASILAVYREGDASLALRIAGFITAAAATGFMFQPQKNDESAAKNAADAGKRKNDQQGFDPMSLLSEDDLAELREDVKDSLRRRLLQSEDGELSSVDALLADHPQKKRR